MIQKSNRNQSDSWFLFGIAFMFFSLVLLSSAGKELDLEHNEAVMSFFSSFDTSSHLSILAFLAIGTIITCIVQSSAAVMAITILLCSTGVLPIYLGIALVMGENIGTTATANLAALGANTEARRAALAHLLFNVFGVIWVVCVFYPFVDMVCHMVGYDVSAGGQHKPFAKARKRLETNFSQFADQSNIMRNYAKDYMGFFTKIISKVSAFTVSQDINKINDKPIGRIKYAPA